MSSREERIGLNEAVFREVNERIEALAQTFELKDDPLDLVCECGDAACVQRITMSREEYEQLRSNAHHFAVYSGHEIPDVEEVISQMKGYDVVSKDKGVPERVAEETNPRS
ncbi:MAG: hypothetical protein WCF27_08360 [Gaiellaceae bacterium]